jgi:mediator of RNA polymerase II transcription subunit 15
MEIPNLLQGEVARLDNRFLVTLHQQHQVGSKTIQLLCHLKDKNLPSVPAIPITVPEDYPHTSPICDTDMEEYNTTPFLQKVQKLLAGQLLQLPDRYALSALMGAWEMSVRKACNPTVL